MRKNIFILFLLIVLYSCSQEQEIKYRKHISDSGLYTVMIPEIATLQIHAGNFLYFLSDQHNLFIVIDLIDDDQTIDSEIAKGGTFQYYKYRSSHDTLSFYKVTKGVNPLWNAFELYSIKNIGGNRFCIKVSSDKMGRAKLESIITVIHNSLRLSNNGEN